MKILFGLIFVLLNVAAYTAHAENQPAQDDTKAIEALTDRVWKQLENSAWIADGRGDAKRIVYVFTDPNCPFCNKFWTDARPWVNDGKVQLRHIMVGILRSDSMGKAAALLSAPDPQAALARHERQHASGGIAPMEDIPDKVRARLNTNHELMQQLGSFATPTIFYKNANGWLQGIRGAPSTDTLTDILGPR